MRRRHGKPAGLGGILLGALVALALLALPSAGAAAKDRHHEHEGKGHHHGKHHRRFHIKRVHGSDGGAAGTIASYDPATGKLVINLAGDETISGTVTDQTRIRCGHGCPGHREEGEDDSTASASSHGDNSGPGSGDEDNSGPGAGPPPPPVSGPPGQGDDENDDPPGHDGTPPGASEGPGNGADHSAANCTTAALVVGATVDEAELKLRDGVATFTEIDLERSTDDSSTPAS